MLLWVMLIKILAYEKMNDLKGGWDKSSQKWLCEVAPKTKPSGLEMWAFFNIRYTTQNYDKNIMIHLQT